MTEAEQLVERLANVELEAHLDDPAKLTAAMAERQGLLTMLQNTDTTKFDLESRDRFQARLKALLVRDEELLGRIAVHLEEKRKSLQQLVPGRAAIRGYRGTVTSDPPPMRRIG